MNHEMWNGRDEIDDGFDLFPLERFDDDDDLFPLWFDDDDEIEDGYVIVNFVDDEPAFVAKFHCDYDHGYDYDVVYSHSHSLIDDYAHCDRGVRTGFVRQALESRLAGRLPPPDDAHDLLGWAVLSQDTREHLEALVALSPQLGPSITATTKAIAACASTSFNTDLQRFKAAMTLVNDAHGHINEDEKHEFLAAIQQQKPSPDVTSSETTSFWTTDRLVASYRRAEISMDFQRGSLHGSYEFCNARRARAEDLPHAMLLDLMNGEPKAQPKTNCAAFVLNKVAIGAADLTTEYITSMIGCILYRQWLDWLDCLKQYRSARRTKPSPGSNENSPTASGGVEGRLAAARARQQQLKAKLFAAKVETSDIKVPAYNTVDKFQVLQVASQYLSSIQRDILLTKARSLRTTKTVTISITKPDGEMFEARLLDCLLVGRVKLEVSKLSGISVAAQEIYAMDGEQALDDDQALFAICNSETLLLELLLVVSTGEKTCYAFLRSWQFTNMYGPMYVCV
jgi:hypothetical protein